MADIGLTSKLVPLGSFALASASDLQGGFHVVEDAAARNAIPTDRRVAGMLVYQRTPGTWFQLSAAPWDGTDADWTADAIGGGGGGGGGTFYFNQDGTQAGSSFTDWAALWAAVTASPGLKIILVEGTAVVPAGTYLARGSVEIVGIGRTPPDPEGPHYTTLSFSTNARIRNLRAARNISIAFAATSPFVQGAAGDDDTVGTIVLENVDAVSASAAPLITFPTTLGFTGQDGMKLFLSGQISIRSAAQLIAWAVAATTHELHLGPEVYLNDDVMSGGQEDPPSTLNVYRHAGCWYGAHYYLAGTINHFYQTTTVVQRNGTFVGARRAINFTGTAVADGNSVLDSPGQDRITITLDHPPTPPALAVEDQAIPNGATLNFVAGAGAIVDIVQDPDAPTFYTATFSANAASIGVDNSPPLGNINLLSGTNVTLTSVQNEDTGAYDVTINSGGGDGGAPGADGINAFTTTGGFTQPAASDQVTIPVASSAWMGVGQTLFVVGGGYYGVIAIPNATSVTLVNFGYASVNAAEGATIAADAAVVAAGVIGPTGPTGPQGDPGPTGPGGVGTVAIGTAGTVAGTRPEINFIAGTGITVGTVDNGAEDRVDVTITATGGGGGGTSTAPAELVFVAGVQNGVPDATARVGQRIIDLTAFPATIDTLTRAVTLIACLDTTGGTIEFRLWNATDAEYVTFGGGAMTTTASTNTELTRTLTVGAAAGNLKSGHSYRAEVTMSGGTSTDIGACTGARLLITYA